MKNSIIFLLLFTPLIGFSQRGYGYYEYEVDKFFRTGLTAGLNMNKIQGKSFTNEYSFNYGCRGFMQFNFSRKFGVQPEVVYSQVSAKQSNDYSAIIFQADSVVWVSASSWWSLASWSGSMEGLVCIGKITGQLHFIL